MAGAQPADPFAKRLNLNYSASKIASVPKSFAQVRPARSPTARPNPSPPSRRSSGYSLPLLFLASGTLVPTVPNCCTVKVVVAIVVVETESTSMQTAPPSFLHSMLLPFFLILFGKFFNYSKNDCFCVMNLRQILF